MLERIVRFFVVVGGACPRLRPTEDGKQTPFCAEQPRCLPVQAMEPRTKAFSAKIVTYLFLETLLLSGQAQKTPCKVNGIVGGTALLSVMVPHALLVVEVRWRFASAGPAKARLGDSKKREFLPFNLSFTNYSQLIQRLDMFNETTLRIRNLTKGDGGLYKADVQFNDGNINEEEFQLKVFDSVPIPLIEMRALVFTSDGCNVTLVCTANAINISWSKQDPLGNWIQMQNNSDGNMLNLSINNQTATKDEYFCFAKSPAEEKNASIVVVCPMRPPQRTRTMLYVIISILLALAAIGVPYFYFWRKRKKKKLERNHEACTKVELRETRSGDILYADIVLDNPEGIDQCPGSKAQRPIVLPTQTSKPTIYNEICVP